MQRHRRWTRPPTPWPRAITAREPPPGVIFHSDRGTQYASNEFDQFAHTRHIRRSLGRTGVCYDNAVAESFFTSYKKELIHARPWPDLAAVKSAMIMWVEDYCNTRKH